MDNRIASDQIVPERETLTVAFQQDCRRQSVRRRSNRNGGRHGECRRRDSIHRCRRRGQDFRCENEGRKQPGEGGRLHCIAHGAAFDRFRRERRSRRQENLGCPGAEGRGHRRCAGRQGVEATSRGRKETRNLSPLSARVRFSTLRYWPARFLGHDPLRHFHGRSRRFGAGGTTGFHAEKPRGERTRGFGGLGV